MKAYISELISESIKQLAPGEAAEVLATSVFDVAYPKSEFGDYATNAAMVLLKKFNEQPAKNPADFAQQIAETAIQLDKNNVFSKIESAGGFINFTLSEQYLFERIEKILMQREKFGQSDFGESRKVIVEYFQNNIAKPPHVGHLRSAVIGDSLIRIMKFIGYDAVSDTHVGDWGTQFGILLYAYKTMGEQAAVEQDPVQELNKLYVAMSAQIEQQPELRDLGKAEFQKLEQGDRENRELWEWFVQVSLEDFERYRKLLGLVPFDYNLGESFYEEKMQEVLQIFAERRLLTTGDTGEVYVDLEEHGLGRCILVKSDGATTYHLRDFATYLFRKQEFNFYRNLYIVDVRQSHHFRQLFRVLEMAGYSAETDSAHIDFGFMSLPEGAISTRKGNTISLEKLISEAETRAKAIIDEKNPELQDKAVVARQVALAAIKYFDLSHNRSTEIVFNWDHALSFDGNTGPYLQYTHARIHGIMRKSVDEAQVHQVKLQPAELMIMRKLNQFPEVLEDVAADFLPSTLCTYLFELSQNLNTFYQAVPVLKEEDLELRRFRLALLLATAQILRNGLNLLGIEAPEEM